MKNALIITVTVLLACSDTADGKDGTAWQFVGDMGDDSDSDSSGLNNHAPNSASPIDAGRPTPNCDGELVVQLVDGPLSTENARPIVIADGAWWYLRGDEFGGQQLTRQFEINGESEMFRRDVVAMLGAGGAGVLFIADNSLILLDPETGSERVLAPADSARPWQSAGFATAAHRLVGDSHVAWSYDGTWLATPTDVAQLATTGGVPYVRDGAIAYAESNEFVTVFENGLKHHLSEPFATNLAFSADHLYFVRNGSGLMNVRRDALDMAQPRAVQPPDVSECDGVAINEDGTELLASCRMPSDGVATALYYGTNGSDWTLRTEAFGELHHTYAVDDGWIAYANFNSTPPMMVVVSPDGEQSEIASIGQACLSCGAYWPPNYVEIEDGKMAWNYAFDGGDDPSFQQKLGLAQLCAD